MIAAFIETLAQTAVPPHCVNPYGTGNRHNDSRRHNLQLYLTQMAAQQPKIMLVGEAPGYRGCRLSGIPFVSRHILQNGVENVALFGTQRGYHLVDEWPHIQKEASATMVWQAIAAMQPLPLLWNAFPFHPHQSGRPQSNRKPTRSELALGEPFMRRLQQMFGNPLLVAVGNTAVSALTAWQLPHHKVRHPSHGGKAQFTKGLLTISADLTGFVKTCQVLTF